MIASPKRRAGLRPALALLAAVTCGTASSAAGELVADDAPRTAASGSAVVLVIAHADAGFVRLSAREVRKLFMGKSRRLPDGSRAVLAGHEPSASRFNAVALGRSDAEVASAWARLRFAGRTRPPRAFDSLSELLAFVSATPSAVAWLPARLPPGARTEGVKAVYAAP